MAIRKWKMRAIVAAISLSHCLVAGLLNNYSVVQKLSLTWWPRLISIDYKRSRMTTSKKSLALFIFTTFNISYPWRKYELIEDQSAVEIVGFSGCCGPEEV